MSDHGRDPSRAPSFAVDQELVDAAIALVHARFGESGAEADAAAMRLRDGKIVTSVAPAALNPAAELCHETGAR